MKTKHTPGPWSVGRELTSLRPGSIPIEANVPSYKGSIGPMQVAYANGFKGEQEANARLIAAAPALAEAIKRLLGCPELNWDETDDETKSAIANARAALRTAGLLED